MTQRVFGILVGLLPREFREEYGAAMRLTHAERLADARSRGRAAGLRTACRELCGCLWLIVSARLGETGAERGMERRPIVMDAAVREMRHALRRLKQTPLFSLSSAATLGLAIGANVAIFAVVYRVVIAPLPYPEQSRLVALDHGAPGVDLPSGLGMSVGLYREYRELPSIEEMAIYTGGAGTLSGDGEAERVSGVAVTPSLGVLTGARPAQGRWFTEADASADAPMVAILMHELWVRRYGSQDVLGQTITINGRAHEVVGVMPPSYRYPDFLTQYLVPLRLSLDSASSGGFNYAGIARLKPGVTVERARGEMNAVIADLPARFPYEPELTAAMTGNVALTALPQTLKEWVVGSAAETLWVMLGAVFIVLVIACVNLANLFLVRADGRQREVAVRQALGAGRSKLAAFFVSEALLVALAGSLIGLGVAAVGIRLLVEAAPVSLPRLDEVRVGALGAGYAITVGVLATLCFGLIPFVRRPITAAAVLQDSGRGNTSSVQRMRARQTLMAAQVALALVLLVAAGLMTQSFVRIQRIDPGFRADSRLVFRIGLPTADYPAATDAAQFHEQLLERLNALAGVASAAFTTTLPLEGDGWGDPLDVEGRPTPTGVFNPVVRMRRVSPDFWQTLAVPLRRGRLLDRSDATGSTNAIVVDETFADVYFRGEDPIGRRVRPAGEDGDYLTIVGVVGNVAIRSVREDPVPKLYAPMLSEAAGGMGTTHTTTYVVRTQGDPLALVPAVRRVLAELDPTVALARAERFTDVVARANASLAFTMILLVIAAAMSLLLGIIGVYAVISYAVAQRTSEIGVRLALGARPTDVAAMILRQSGVVITAGVIAGLAVALAWSRVLQSLLYGVAPRDPLTYVAVAAGLFAIAMLATLQPAWRAARQNPLDSLRA